MNPLRRHASSAIFISPPTLPVPSNFKTELRPSYLRRNRNANGNNQKSNMFQSILPPLLSIEPPNIPSPSSLRHVRVKGDGRCLFRAIAKNLAYLDNNRALPEHLERQDADYLRQLAWKVICKTRRQEFVNRNIIEGSIHSYCAVSNQPTFYAGEPELLALSDELKIPIAIYLRPSNGHGPIRNIATHGQQYLIKSKSKSKKSTPRIVNLLYVNGNHYDALLSR